MLIMQKEKLLVREIAPPDAFPAREPMLLRHEKEKRFPPERMPRQVRDLIRAGRDHEIERPVLEPSGQLFRRVLEQLESDFRIRVLKSSDQPRQNIKRDRRDRAHQ